MTMRILHGRLCTISIGAESSVSARLQIAEIEFHREILGISPVMLHKMPGWWMRRACYADKGWGRIDAEQSMYVLEQRTGMAMRIIDHWGQSKTRDGHCAFVTEPYLPYWDSRVMSAVQQIAGWLGVHFNIYDVWESWWYPGHTIRIEFFECPQLPNPCLGCMTMDDMRKSRKERRRT